MLSCREAAVVLVCVSEVDGLRHNQRILFIHQDNFRGMDHCMETLGR